MSGTWIGSCSKWRQVTAFICEDLDGLLREANEERARCQEIGLVALMFFFELLFSLCFFAISLYVFLTNLFLLILFLIC